MSARYLGKVPAEAGIGKTTKIPAAHMGGTMKCPHLKKRFVCSCSTGEAPYFPSDFQLHEYCRSKEHKRCPFYLRNVIRRREVNGLVSA